MNLARSFRALWPLLAFAALVGAFAIGLTKDPRVLPSEMIDRPVPNFALPDLYTPEKIHSQDIFTGKISLINVFGSWCVACEVEHPKLMSLSREGRFFLVGVDWRDTREKGQRWLARNGDPYATVVFDEDSRLAIDLGVTGAPESFLIDAAGRIRYKHVGIITDAVWDDILLPIIITLEAET